MIGPKNILLLVFIVIQLSYQDGITIKSADRIIYGGTSAAVIATVEVSHPGQSVIVVPPDTHPGGLSSGGPGFTDTGDKSTIGGLSRECYNNVWQYYNDSLAWKWEKHSEYGNKGQVLSLYDDRNTPSMRKDSFSNLVRKNINESKPLFNKENGFWEVELVSEYESEPTKVSILLPDNLPADGEKLPVLYILPVINKIGEYGDGLVEAKKADLSNKYRLICVRPCFTSIPWYGDHATNPKLRHESYILKRLVPFIDSLYPTQANAEGRWLLGFSKSGWGAFTLLMRNPDIFGYAAAWDVPFMLNGENNGKNWGPMGLKVNFGTKEQMQQSLPTKLAEKHSAWLSEKMRLVVGVGKYWESQSISYHNFLNDLKIPHVYRPDLVFEHRWDTGWFIPLVEDLTTIANQQY